MAAVDYHLCAACGGKAFYDANIDCPKYVSSWDENEREFGFTEVKAVCSRCTDKFTLEVKPKERSK